MKTSIIAAVWALARLVSSHRFGHMGLPLKNTHIRQRSETSFTADNSTGWGFFTQPLDHDNPTKGTFQQKFWWNTEFWAGPGSPIIFFTPGEVAAGQYFPGYNWLSNSTINGIYAEAVKGAVVMIEHRYYGESSPYETLNAETLQYLTLHQTILDFTNFANNVVLPFDLTAGSSNAGKAPWVFPGCSYSGALSAWTEKLVPGTFWAHHATSAPVEAIYDWWQYFTPILENLPKNCSNDISTVIEHMDHVFLHGKESEKVALKARFGLESLHNDDVMFTTVLLKMVFIKKSSGSNVEAGAAVTPDANGVGLDKALAGYAKWINETYIPGFCQKLGYTDERETKCMDSYDPTNLMYTDLTVLNPAYRQWQWLLCNEAFGWWQTGAPKGQKTVSSRLLTAEYFQQQCSLYFPTVNGFSFGSGRSPQTNIDRVNKLTEGWARKNATRVITTSGEFDSWKNAGMSSTYRPGGPFAGTPDAPVHVIPGGTHCNDYFWYVGFSNSGVQAVIDANVAQMVQWVSEFPKH
ncbi:related to serine protease [Rhynchosporium agropyri]|uniref:Related to serine protease n=1 Tax=Rhynchosporium agropyri TaxID=914238 RepID=A0A1E1JUI7_9HELO|nr:related to serine protease [Rhynchosporium agropyri]